MNENESDFEIICSTEESNTRLLFCQSCEHFKFNDDGLTICESSGCLINLMTTFKFKVCPIGVWV